MVVLSDRFVLVRVIDYMIELVSEPSVGMLTVASVGVILLLVRQRSRSRVVAPKGLKLPPVWNTGLPVVGNFIAFAKDPLGTVSRAKKDLGGVFTINLITEKCTFLIGAGTWIS